MITGGFGTTMDLERGTSRQWVVGRDGVKRWADNGEPVVAPAEPAPIDEWAERCLGTWPQLQEHWKYMRAETKRLKRENSLLRQALTRAVALPMGQLPHGDEYFTTMLNGNVIVTPNARVDRPDAALSRQVRSDDGLCGCAQEGDE